MLQAVLYFLWYDSQRALHLPGELHHPGSRAYGMNDWLFWRNFSAKFSLQDERLCSSVSSPPLPLFSGRLCGCLCRGSNHRGSDHHGLATSLWYIPIIGAALRFELHRSLSLRQEPCPSVLVAKIFVRAAFVALLAGSHRSTVHLR